MGASTGHARRKEAEFFLQIGQLVGMVLHALISKCFTRAQETWLCWEYDPGRLYRVSREGLFELDE